MTSSEYATEPGENDEAIDRWGSATLGQDPLLASFTLEPYSAVRPHVPFYRFFHYPDILDLRANGFEVDHFTRIFDSLDEARYSQALEVHRLLRQRGVSRAWNPRRAREIEFMVRASMHRFGISEVPSLLRKMLGRAFPDESISNLSIDLINVYFWGCLALVARRYSWKEPALERYADYLELPLLIAGLLPEKEQNAA